MDLRVPIIGYRRPIPSSPSEMPVHPEAVPCQSQRANHTLIPSFCPPSSDHSEHAPRFPAHTYAAGESAAAEVAGIPGARAFSDAFVETFTAMLSNASARNRPFSYLALSGGGGDGAYGAGIMNGWTAAGTRPEFSLVSGVSTGALIAPFAFLGPAYDPVLTEIYTSGVAESLVKNPSVVNVLFSSGLFGDDRLRDLVGRYVTPDLLTAIAAEHARAAVCWS